MEALSTSSLPVKYLFVVCIRDTETQNNSVFLPWPSVCLLPVLLFCHHIPPLSFFFPRFTCSPDPAPPTCIPFYPLNICLHSIMYRPDCGILVLSGLSLIFSLPVSSCHTFWFSFLPVLELWLGSLFFMGLITGLLFCHLWIPVCTLVLPQPVRLSTLLLQFNPPQMTFHSTFMQTMFTCLQQLILALMTQL